MSIFSYITIVYQYMHKLGHVKWWSLFALNFYLSMITLSINVLKFLLIEKHEQISIVFINLLFRTLLTRWRWSTRYTSVWWRPNSVERPWWWYEHQVYMNHARGIVLWMIVVHYFTAIAQLLLFSFTKFPKYIFTLQKM